MELFLFFQPFQHFITIHYYNSMKKPSVALLSRFANACFCGSFSSGSFFFLFCGMRLKIRLICFCFVYILSLIFKPQLQSIIIGLFVVVVCCCWSRSYHTSRVCTLRAYVCISTIRTIPERNYFSHCCRLLFWTYCYMHLEFVFVVFLHWRPQIRIGMRMKKGEKMRSISILCT